MKVKNLVVYFTSGREFMAAKADVSPTKNPDVFRVARGNVEQRINRSKVDYLEMEFEDETAD
jgi:hypothetical protein